MEEKFEYDYAGKASQKRKDVEEIRKKYLPKNENDEKLEKLKKLNAKVENSAMVAGLVLGIVGVLIFGLGLAMILQWEILAWGIVVSIIGFVPTCLAYPIYQKVYKSQKEKYSAEILKLSEEILENEKVEK